MSISSSSSQGTPGTAGAAGDEGLTGGPGRPGLDGEDGIDGFPGPPGPQGPRGIPGAMGPAGFDGEDGLDGLPGPMGATGPQGLAGTNGTNGTVGPAGAQGLSGPAGLDAEEPELPWVIPGPAGLPGTSPLTNFSVTAQTPAAATRTYITGSQIAVPPGKLRIGTMLHWRFNMRKTAAGTAASTFDIAVGTAGTTADAARVSFTKPAGTAVIDEAWIDIIATVRGPLSASGVVVGQFIMSHNLATTGHATIPIVCVNTISSAFDITVANLFVGICITSGASDAITIQLVQTNTLNL